MALYWWVVFVLWARQRAEALARRSRSRTRNQPRLQHLAAGLGALRLDSLQQETGGEDTHLVARLVDAGQRDVAELGQIGIVVADEGDVAWDGEARLANRAQDSHGGKIVGSEDGGGAFSFAKKPLCSEIPALIGELSGGDLYVLLEAQASHCTLIALAA